MCSLTIRIDDTQLLHYQHKQLLSKLSHLVANYTIPEDISNLQKQHNTILQMYKTLLENGGDKRRHNRGSREERLPNGCKLRQRLVLPDKKGYHEKILYKKDGTYICTDTGKLYKTLNQANEDHFVECKRVWTKEDELKNPRHKEGKSKNAVSAWGNGTNTQAFYALRANTEDQYDIPIIDVNDDEWFQKNISNFHILE